MNRAIDGLRVLVLNSQSYNYSLFISRLMKPERPLIR